MNVCLKDIGLFKKNNRYSVLPNVYKMRMFVKKQIYLNIDFILTKKCGCIDFVMIMQWRK